MSNKSLECYHLDPQSKSLRVQVAPGRSLLMPFEDLVFAELFAGDTEETLTMHFDTHDVHVRGHSLRRQNPKLREVHENHNSILASRRRQFSTKFFYPPASAATGTGECRTNR